MFVSVFAPLPACILWKGQKFPSLAQAHKCLGLRPASDPCCSLLTSTMHECFDLFRPMQAQYSSLLLVPELRCCWGQAHWLFTVALGSSLLPQPLPCSLVAGATHVGLFTVALGSLLLLQLFQSATSVFLPTLLPFSAGVQAPCQIRVPLD